MMQSTELWLSSAQEILVSPAMLKANNIPYIKFVQKPREFVINYPGKFFGSGLTLTAAIAINARSRNALQGRTIAASTSDTTVPSPRTLPRGPGLNMGPRRMSAIVERTRLASTCPSSLTMPRPAHGTLFRSD